MSVQEQFEAAAEKVKGFNDVSNDEKLQLYGLYKQAKEGDVTGDRPGMFNPTGKAKWDAWKKVEGTSKEDAMKKYVELVEELAKKQ